MPCLDPSGVLGPCSEKAMNGLGSMESTAWGSKAPSVTPAGAAEEQGNVAKTKLGVGGAGRVHSRKPVEVGCHEELSQRGRGHPKS